MPYTAVSRRFSPWKPDVQPVYLSYGYGRLFEKRHAVYIKISSIVAMLDSGSKGACSTLPEVLNWYRVSHFMFET